MNNIKGQTEIIVVVVTVLVAALLAAQFFGLDSPTGKAPPCCEDDEPDCEGCTASTPTISVQWNEPNVVVTFLGQAGHLKKRVKGTTDWTLLGNGASPYYDSDVVEGTTYEYYTFNLADYYSAVCSSETCRWRCSVTTTCTKASSIVEILVPVSAQSPNPVTSLNAVPGSSPGKINLSWSAPESGPAPDHYEITVTASSQNLGTFTANNTSYSYSTTLSPSAGGVLHYFSVKSCNSVGCSSAVNISSYPKIGVTISGPSSGQTQEPLQFNATGQYAGSPSFAWVMLTPNSANCSFNNPNIANPVVTCSTAGSATIKVTLTANGNDPVIALSNFLITQSDSTPPVVAVTFPSSGALIKGTITVTANASDAESGIDFVEFFIDSLSFPLCTDYNAPYSCSWNTSGLNGSHSVKAKATNNAGNSTEHFVTVIIDNTNPVVSISSPVNGATVSGTKTISASASDSSPGIIANLKLYIDGSYKTIYYTSSFNYPWNTATETNGSHSISVVAEDNAGNTNAKTITVNVSNAVPQLGAEAGGPYSGTNQTVIQLTGQAINAEGTASFLWEELSDSAGCNISFPASQNPTVSCSGSSGSATLKLTVTASNGTATDTALVSITPVYNLSVNINGPYTAIAGQQINLSALVEDSVGTVNYSWSILGCTPSSSIQSNPTVVCNSSSNVQLTVTADNGTANDTSTITITAQPDETDPVVSITSHSNNQEVDAVEIIVATATDASGIKDVKFFVDNSLKSTDSSSPYEYSWNTAADVSNGSHNLKVVAEDTAGNTAEAIITVSVNNVSDPQCGDGVINSGEECEVDSDCFTTSKTQCDYSTQKYGTRSITCSSCSCVVGYWNYSAKNSSLYCDSCDSCKDNEEGNCNEDCQSSNIPDKPTGLDIVEVTKDSITIEWNPNTESDLKRYIIYYGKSSEKYDYEETALKSETSLTLTGLSSVTRYYIALTAVNLGGNESEFSEEVTARTKEKEVVVKTVPVPTGLKAVVEDKSIVLEWSVVVPEPDYYVVQRKVEGDYFEEIGISPENSFEDSDVKNGTKYFYRVAAFLDGKTSDVSDQIKVEFAEEKKEEDNLLEWSVGSIIVIVSLALTYVLFTYEI